jgi:hypothetical protein
MGFIKRQDIEEGEGPVATSLIVFGKLLKSKDKQKYGTFICFNLWFITRMRWYIDPDTFTKTYTHCYPRVLYKRRIDVTHKAYLKYVLWAKK